MDAANRGERRAIKPVGLDTVPLIHVGRRSWGNVMQCHAPLISPQLMNEMLSQKSAGTTCHGGRVLDMDHVKRTFTLDPGLHFQLRV